MDDIDPIEMEVFEEDYIKSHRSCEDNYNCE